MAKFASNYEESGCNWKALNISCGRFSSAQLPVVLFLVVVLGTQGLSHAPSSRFSTS
jgi:hypothetical protein